MLCTALRTGRGIAMHSSCTATATHDQLLAEYSWIAALNESGWVPQPWRRLKVAPGHVAFEDRHHQLDLVPWIEAEPLAAVSTDDAGPKLRRIIPNWAVWRPGSTCSPGSGRFRQDLPERLGRGGLAGPDSFVGRFEA